MMEETSTNNATNVGDVRVSVLKPRRVLHFSDGVAEEFDDAEEPELQAASDLKPVVDPKTLSWGSWVSHHAWSSGGKILNAVDYVGEGLANFFGITTPKYQMEIEEYERMEEERKKEEEESAGWVQNCGGKIPLVTNAPGREIDKNAV